MARVEAVVVCLLIVAMDVAAGVLGIHAEKAQSQGRHLKILFIECRQPVPQAYKLGVAAAAVLAASHAIANIVGGCYCTWPCCSCGQARRSSPNRQMASFALVLTWMVLLVGLALLILGALPNSKKSMAECGLVRHRFLSIGGILCFVHAVFCLVYYVSANAAAREEGRGSGSKPAGVYT
ncbi:hypothetical protein D1007_53629 [Hordeum vulgare]|uniref:Uncharacterized protein n=1 Tax=Hordeum vulgare subsp. vulgare TaxID=112509 RepID=A0A8I6XFI4_HORVV|nr:uncharacterized protein LOC123429897 [Hordeum vulgare subsp. vulgare]KAE8774061.1 hypothetical protein D1007_53629 [Hordeum vulgare]KAI5013360.1 hypothetical protein ZWY2020_028314 [Hordeum vulgare]